MYDFCEPLKMKDNFCQYDADNRDNHGDNGEVVKEAVKRVCFASEVHDDTKVC